MTKIVIVGGAGYIGSHCAKAFHANGFEVVVLDNFSRGWKDFCKYGNIIEMDIMNRQDLTSALSLIKPDLICHLAAVAYVEESIKNPGMYYYNNVMGTLSILESMREIGMDKIIFSSTCATYGIPLMNPIDENHPQNPINPYGWSKLFCERLISDFGYAHKIKFIMLRYFNAGGADPEGEIGERHNPETHVIPRILKSVIDGNSNFVIHGGDFRTRDGTPLRDYIHVGDLADAHLRAANFLMEGGQSDVFNLGTGTGTTVAEIADAVEKVTGRHVVKTIGERRVGDPEALVADNAKARNILGWAPRYSDINNIISTAWRWHLKEQNQ